MDEFLSVLPAVVVWKHRLLAGCSFFQVRSDSTAALSATDKLAGTSPITNFIAAELALRNKSADWLSRRAEPSKTDEPELDCFNGVKSRAVPDRWGDLFLSPAPDAGQLEPLELCQMNKCLPARCACQAK